MIALEIYSATSLEYTATISFGSYSVKCICHCFKYSFGNFLETPFEFFSEILLGIPLTIYVGNSFHSSFGILFEQYFFDNSLGSCLVILFFQIWYFFGDYFKISFEFFFEKSYNSSGNAFATSLSLSSAISLWTSFTNLSATLVRPSLATTWGFPIAILSGYYLKIPVVFLSPLKSFLTVLFSTSIKKSL